MEKNEINDILGIENSESQSHASQSSKKFSTINKVGLIFSLLIVLMNIFVQIGVSNYFFDNKELCYNVLYTLPMYLSPFIVLFSINNKYRTVSFRLFIGAITITILSFLTLKITGDVSFFLGDSGRNLYIDRIKLWTGISVFLGLLNAILKKR